MKYKLIASDLDETLLNENHHVCQKNIDLIKKARDLGVKFVPATGRLFTGVIDVLKELDLYDKEGEYVLSANGGIITENKGNKILKCCGLTLDKTKELFAFGKQYNICIQIHTLNNIFIYNINEDEKQRVTYQGVKFSEFEEENLDFLKDEKIIKMLFETTDIPYLESLEPKLQSIVEGVVSVSYSSSRYMELNQLGVDKGQGLKDLANLLNISLDEIIAVGDHFNDIDLLKTAGLSVAAGNAIEEVKAICDYTTKANHNEGVLAEVIEKFIL